VEAVYAVVPSWPTMPRARNGPDSRYTSVNSVGPGNPEVVSESAARCVGDPTGINEMGMTLCSELERSITAIRRRANEAMDPVEVGCTVATLDTTVHGHDSRHCISR
jgi:hypothetical protein